eukprot:312615_1
MSWFKAGKDMIINGRMVTKSGGGHKTAYGVQEVSVGQHEWKIKAHNCGSSNWLFIGISADTSHSDTIMHNSTTTEHYLLYSGSGNLYSKNNPSGIAYANGGGKFTNGDTITVHLDLDKQQMSFSKNGNNIGIAFSNIVKTQKYRLAVEAYYPSTQFELISDTNLSSNKNEENKNEEEKMKQESKNIVLSETDEKTIELIGKQMNEMTSEMVKMRKETKEERKEMRSEMVEMRKEMVTMRKETKEERKEMISEINSLKQIILSNNKNANDNNNNYNNYNNENTKDICVFLKDEVNLPQYIPYFIDAG